MKTAVALIFCFGLAAWPAAGEDWPQWNGINRDGKSPETGLLKSWPAEGPKLVQTITGLGAGWSAPAIVGGKVYITGKFDMELHGFCFDADGKKVWEVPVGGEIKSWPGARAAVTVEGNGAYIQAGGGRVSALDKDTGKEIWKVELTERFKAPVPQHGFAGALLVDGDKVVCVPGAKDACIAALDKKTGQTLWTSKGLSDPAAYSSLIAFDFQGVRQYTVLTAKGVVSVKAQDGSFLWRYDRPASKNANVPTPIYDNGYVFCASGYGNGGGAVKLKKDGDKITAEPAWETKDMDCHHGGFVVVDGYIYGNNKNGWACLSLQDGQTKWNEQPKAAPGIGKGSVTYADGMLYTLSEKGEMGLAEANPKEYKPVCSFKLPRGPENSWTHPVICNGKLYLRRADKLYVYAIK